MQKFKTGDKVKDKNGTEGVIVSYLGVDGEGDVMYTVKVNQNGRFANIREQAIEFALEKTNTTEFKRGDKVVFEGEEVEFISDLGETDNLGDRFVIKDRDGDYNFAGEIESVPNKKPSISEKIKKLNESFGFDADTDIKTFEDFKKAETKRILKGKNAPRDDGDVDPIKELLKKFLTK